MGQDSSATCAGTTVCPAGLVDLNGKGSFTNDFVLDVSQGRALHRFTLPIQGAGDGTTLRVPNLEVSHSLGGTAGLPSGSQPTVVRTGNGNTITSTILSANVTHNTLAKRVQILISMSNLAGIGVRYYGDDNVTSVIQVNSVFGRDNIDEYTFNATIRASFSFATLTAGN